MVSIGPNISNYYTSTVRYSPIQAARISAPKVNTNTRIPQSNAFLQMTTRPQPELSARLGLLDKSLLNLGVFQEQTFKTAMKNNPKIMEFCNQNGLEGKIEVKNLNDTSNHTKTTEKFATQIGEYMGFEGEDLQNLKTAAKFHDIGKVLIDREIFAKPGRLDAEDKKTMDLHSSISEQLLKGLGFSKDVRDIAGGHHDGYDRFDLDRINKLAQICKVADIYSALTEERSYKKALTNDEAFGIMDKMAANGELYPKALTMLKHIVANAFVKTDEE